MISEIERAVALPQGLLWQSLSEGHCDELYGQAPAGPLRLEADRG
jgi:hypothetical protein